MEVSVPVSPSFRFSPVGLDDDGAGLCVELVLPIVCSCPEDGLDAPPGPIACPEDGLDAPPAFSAKETVVVPVKRAIATTAAAILRCMLHSFCCAAVSRPGPWRTRGLGARRRLTYARRRRSFLSPCALELIRNTAVGRVPPVLDLDPVPELAAAMGALAVLRDHAL